jgi:hypothetical protein
MSADAWMHSGQDAIMKAKYSLAVEQTMRQLFQSLAERERRHYAAVEAAKLGHGGIRYLAAVLGCDEKTIRRGIKELDNPSDLLPGRSRKKGGADKPA